MATQKKNRGEIAISRPAKNSNTQCNDDTSNDTLNSIGSIIGPLTLAAGKRSIEFHKLKAADPKTPVKQAGWHWLQADLIGQSLETWGG